MSIVDLAKARAFADSIHGRTMDDSWSDAADWIRELADEVESLQRALADERADRLAASLEVTKLADEVESLQRLFTSAQGRAATAEVEREKLAAERDAAVAGLQELYNAISSMLREARHIADNHPDPAATGAAMRILESKP